MSKQSVEDLLELSGSYKEFRVKFDNTHEKEKFVELVKTDGYYFSVEELIIVLCENGDMFESNGNPHKKSIWIK